MNLLKKPPFTKVLCKRTQTSGKPFWWDDYAEPPKHKERHERENRSFIEGTWYEITKWKQNWFWVIDSQGNSHCHTVYSDAQKADFPDHCDVFGPRDYAKWFYTPEELAEVEAGTYKMSFKEKNAISVFPGQYHWVKTKEDKWIIAQCSGQHPAHGKHWWTVMGSDIDKCDFDFAEIGHQVDSMRTQQENKDKLKDYSELNDTIFPMLDSLKAEGTEDEKWHAPVAYHKPFVEEATSNYFDKSFGRISDSDLFFGGDKEKETEEA
jgi:hypothetical protein